MVLHPKQGYQTYTRNFIDEMITLNSQLPTTDF